jgi:prepilin-type N-terminal cleavage/methylation domain-containing protein
MPSKRIRTVAHCRSGKSGFTLVELLVATSIAALLSTLTWIILTENTKGNIRSEFRRRLHEDWNQATTLIQSEISMSDLITSDNVTAETIPDEYCPLLQDSTARLMLRMHLVGTLPEIIYGTRTIGSLPATEDHQWMGNPNDGVLIRCGPEREIGTDGQVQYRQGTYQQSILLDNLDLSQGDGLVITQSSNSEKLVEFSLSMNETMRDNSSKTIRTKTLSSSGVSRIDDIQHIPSEASICQTICQTEDVSCGHGVKTLLLSDPRYYIAPTESIVFGTKTICTNRSLQFGDGIEGANGNYVIDGNPSPIRSHPRGLTLEGGAGRNILLGTPADDTLKGGPDHDGLIGRGGKDKLYGFDGNDNFVPWPSETNENENVIVNGGDGFDRIYLNNKKSSYSLNHCDSNSCKVTSASNGVLELSNVEMLVFKASNQRL